MECWTITIERKLTAYFGITAEDGFKAVKLFERAMRDPEFRACVDHVFDDNPPDEIIDFEEPLDDDSEVLDANLTRLALEHAGTRRRKNDSRQQPAGHDDPLTSEASHCIHHAWMDFHRDGYRHALVDGYGRLTQEIAQRARIIAVSHDEHRATPEQLVEHSDLSREELERRAACNHPTEHVTIRMIADEAVCHAISTLLGDDD